jgi:hypothetical protein
MRISRTSNELIPIAPYAAEIVLDTSVMLMLPGTSGYCANIPL